MSRYLSNGTMGMMWLDEWCHRCVNDHVASHVPDKVADFDNGCSLLVKLYIGDDEIPELIQHNRPGGWDPRDLECRMFERCPCEDDLGWEPTPEPIPDPNQGVLFDVIPETPTTPMQIVEPVPERQMESVEIPA